MDQVVSNITLEVNRRKIENFRSVTEKTVAYRKEIPFMNKTGIKKMTPRYGLSVEYIELDGVPVIDWEDVENGRLTIQYDSGRRKTWPGVNCISIGDLKHADGDDPVRVIEMVADKPFEG